MYNLSVTLLEKFLTHLSYLIDKQLLSTVVGLWFIRQSLSHLTSVSTGNAEDKLFQKLHAFT